MSLQRRTFATILLAGTAVAGGVGCFSPHYLRSTALPVDAITPPAASVTRNVVLVSIDGLRPDAIDRFGATTLQRLIREGSASLAARTIDPSKTLPSHTSMLSGEPPDEHGVLWNDVLSAELDEIGFDTVFSVARASGYRTAAFFSKPKFSPLQRPGTLDYSQAPGGWFGGWSSARTVGDVRDYLADNRPNLLFVHLADPDRAGHDYGWMSSPYGRAVRTVDASVGRLLSAADAAYGAGQYTVIVTADHGGHDYDHGSADPRDVTIPWIAWGQGVRPGPLTNAIRTFDTAPTVLWLLGTRPPDAWNGTPILDAFAPPDALQTF